MESKLLIKRDYQDKQVYYFPVPTIARQAGFGPYLDYIGPYASQEDARQDEKRLLRKASLIVLRSRPNTGAVWDAKGSKMKRNGLKSEGYEAHKAGVGIETCPYPYTERTGYYWLLGWWEREREANADSLMAEEILNSPKKSRRQRRAGIPRPRQSGPVTTTSNGSEGVKTRLYFSVDPTVCSSAIQILLEAGVDHLLVNPTSWETGKWKGGIHKILCGEIPRHLPSDSELEAYLEFVEEKQEEIDFSLIYEVPGDSEATRTVWLKTVNWLTANFGDTPVEGWPQIVPVWGWGSSLDLLDRYLNESYLVALGGNLAPLLRHHDRGVLQDLVALCHQYKGRLHIGNCGWVSAIEQLLGLAHSIDTSVWMQGYRRNSLCRNAKTGLLSMVPATIDPEYKDLSGHTLCVKNTQTLKSLADDPDNLVVSLAKCSICGGTFNSKGMDRKYCFNPSCATIYNKYYCESRSV